MRSTQFIGLSRTAKDFLEIHARREYQEPNCPHCQKPTQLDFVKEQCGIANGMYYEEIPLYSYELKGGSKISEYVQTSPWSSGPVIFTALKYQDGSTTGEWSEEDIENYL